jgi:hypothetical protein
MGFTFLVGAIDRTGTKPSLSAKVKRRHHKGPQSRTTQAVDALQPRLIMPDAYKIAAGERGRLSDS